MESKNQVILHISDLHFSAKCNDTDLANRKLLFDGLLSRLKTIEDEWHPTIVCITGDITDKGQLEGFVDAKEWLKQLSHELKIDIDRFLLTPGNHDCVRDQQIHPKLIPSTSEEADSLLNNDIPPYLKSRFNIFSNFCEDIGIIPYKIGEKKLLPYREQRCRRYTVRLLQYVLVFMGTKRKRQTLAGP